MICRPSTSRVSFRRISTPLFLPERRSSVGQLELRPEHAVVVVAKDSKRTATSQWQTREHAASVFDSISLLSK